MKKINWGTGLISKKNGRAKEQSQSSVVIPQQAIFYNLFFACG